MNIETMVFASANVTEIITVTSTVFLTILTGMYVCLTSRINKQTVQQTELLIDEFYYIKRPYFRVGEQLTIISSDQNEIKISINYENLGILPAEFKAKVKVDNQEVDFQPHSTSIFHNRHHKGIITLNPSGIDYQNFKISITINYKVMDSEFMNHRFRYEYFCIYQCFIQNNILQSKIEEENDKKST